MVGLLVSSGAWSEAKVMPRRLAQAGEAKDAPDAKSAPSAPAASSPTKKETPPENLPVAEDKATSSPPEAVREMQAEISGTRASRAAGKGFLLFNDVLLDVPLPQKIGITAGIVHDVDRTWEFEYVRSNVALPLAMKNLGSMSDERASLIVRSYFGGNSFNVSYGLSVFQFSMHLGSEVLSRVTSSSLANLDLLSTQAIGVNLAIGHRWVLRRRFTIGVDWIGLAQPLFLTRKKSAILDALEGTGQQGDVETALRVVSFFPRFMVGKIQIGFLF